MLSITTRYLDHSSSPDEVRPRRAASRKADEIRKGWIAELEEENLILTLDFLELILF